MYDEGAHKYIKGKEPRQYFIPSNITNIWYSLDEESWMIETIRGKQIALDMPIEDAVAELNAALVEPSSRFLNVPIFGPERKKPD
jgi:hypothetical protein